MATTYAGLRAMTDDELMAEYDRMAPSVVIGLGFVREELARREAERRAAAMVRLTWSITVMTAVLLVLTVANVVVVLRAV